MNNQVIEAIYPKVRQLATRFTRDITSAEDLAHDVILRLIGTKLPKNIGRGWLYSTVRNRSIDNYRRRSRERKYMSYYVEVTSTGCRESATGKYLVDPPSRDSSSKCFDLKDAISRLKMQLSESQWVTLTLASEGAAYDEIASITGVAIGTVRSRLHHARAKAKYVLSDLCEEH